MKSFNEYVEARDAMPQDGIADPKTGQPKPVMPIPPLPGALRAAANRFNATWDKVQQTSPQRFHDRMLQQRRIRGNVISNVQPFAALASTPAELQKVKNNSMYAMNRLFQSEKQRLK